MSNYSNLKSHVNSDKIKWGVTFAAIILIIAAIILGICTDWYTNWGGKEDDTPGAGVDGGAMLTPDDGKSGVKMTVANIPEEKYGDYEISPLAAETAFTINATVEGENLSAEQKKVDWSEPKFKDSQSEWAQGKDVSEYVTMTHTENQAVVTCHKAFGEKIEIVATSTYNTSVKGTVTADYKEKIEFTGLTIDSKSLTQNTDMLEEPLDITGTRTANVVGQFTHSDAYTVKGDVVTATVTIKPTSELKTGVTQDFVSRFPEYSVTVKSDGTEATIEHFLDSETHNKIFLEGYPMTFTAENMATVYNGLKSLDSDSHGWWEVKATVTGASSHAEAQEKDLGQIRLQFEAIQTWYEAFSGMHITFDHQNIVF